MSPLAVFALVLLAGSCYSNPTKIVGGTPTTIETYPYIVQVEFRSVILWTQSCAANILNELYVLSAAHCFEGIFFSPSNRRVRAGTTNRNSGGSVVNVQQVFNHPAYGVASRFDSDISVIRLTGFLTFSDTIQQGPIAATGTNIPDNSPVIHAGWGTTTQGGSPSSILLHTTIYSINRELCRQRYQGIGQVVTENMICAGLLDVGGADACQGDSGGPLYFGSTNILVGIVSWGQGCANAFFPGVSAAVAPFTSWIQSVAV